MINRCPELGANYGMICFVFLKVIQLSNRLTFPPVSEPKVIKTKTENRTTMTTTGGGGRCFGGSTGYFQTNEEWYVGGLIGCRIPWGQRHTGGVGVGSRLPGDMRKTDMEEELLAWEGIIKLSNIKIQYHQKKKKRTKKKKPNKQYTTFVFTIVHYCRRSPRGLWLLTGRLRHRPVPQCPAPPARLVLWQQPVWHWCFWAAPDVG